MKTEIIFIIISAMEYGMLWLLGWSLEDMRLTTLKEKWKS